MRLSAPLDEVFRSGSHVRVLRALDGLPRGFAVSAREIGRRAGIAHPTASRVLAALTEEGLVLARRAPRADEFELKRDHALAPVLGALFERERGLRQELLSFLRDELGRATAVRAAYLFGSAARGELGPRSDIDVAIVSHRAEEETRRALDPVADAVRRRFGNELSLLVTSAPRGRAGRRVGGALWRRITKEGVRLLPARRAPP